MVYVLLLLVSWSVMLRYVMMCYVMAFSVSGLCFAASVRGVVCCDALFYGA